MSDFDDPDPTIADPTGSILTVADLFSADFFDHPNADGVDYSAVQFNLSDTELTLEETEAFKKWMT